METFDLPVLRGVEKIEIALAAMHEAGRSGIERINKIML